MNKKALFRRVTRAAVVSIAVLLGQTLMIPASPDPPMPTRNWHRKGEDAPTRISAIPVRASISDDAVKKLLDTEVEKQMRENNLPSVVVSIVVPGEGEYVAVKGKANLDTGRVRELEDPFRVASITKTFTASAILQLVDQGKLSKSDKLSNWFPNFPNADHITVDDLLRMRSGIADSADAELLQQYYDDPLMKFDASDSIKRAAGKAGQFEPPDQKTKYVNVNYNLLEEIIRHVPGNDIGVQITEGIFKPLGMKNSWYPTTSDMPGELRGYGWNGRAQKFEDKTVLNPALPGGAGAIISTLADLRTYVRALCKGTFLRPETQKARLEAEPLDGAQPFIKYGEGLALIGRFCGHNGTINGFSSEMFYLPERDATIIINVNRLDADDKSQSGTLFAVLTRIAFPDYVQW
jgi:D-alanyl-D-alanine carboxypeptidase